MFAELYAQPERLEQFMQAMAGISAANFQAFAAEFDFSGYKTMADIGGATGQLSILVAQRHPHVRCTSYDLPVVEPIARRTIDRAGVADRVKAASLDFFAQPIPAADVVTMGMILHDWNLEKKQQLIRAAYKALPAGGALVAIENLIDDERRRNVFGLMMSLNMLIEFGEAFDFTGADFAGWCKEAGFRRTEVLPLQGPASAAIAYK
jgi:predicted O-methyltransferase YrrM